MTSPASSQIRSIQSAAALDLVTEMMAIPGKSRQEGRVAAYIRKRLKRAGIPATAIECDGANKPGRAGAGEIGNLIVKLPGTRRGARRLLMAHIDTVPLCVGSRPVRRGSFIASRDAHTALGADDRAGAAVVLNTIFEIRRQKLDHPPLTLFWPVQEEIGLLGARYVSLSKLGRPTICFNFDGGLAHFAMIGATGDYNIDIDVEGIASHAGAHPERGVSAVAIAGRAISDLVENGWHGLIVKGQKTGTSNIGAISGGEATNVVTSHVHINAEARSHDRKFRKRIVKAFQTAFEKAAATLKNDTGKSGRIRFHSSLKYDSFRLADDEPCVRTALAAIEAVGLEPETKVINGGLDANWMTARGLPTVTLGCGQQDVHTVNETLHIASYLQACRIALLLATGAE
jgi:tripeptide aminopeptidase